MFLRRVWSVGAPTKIYITNNEVRVKKILEMVIKYEGWINLHKGWTKVGYNSINYISKNIASFENVKLALSVKKILLLNFV